MLVIVTVENWTCVKVVGFRAVERTLVSTLVTVSVVSVVCV